jgi:hypothetical protein
MGGVPVQDEKCPVRHLVGKGNKPATMPLTVLVLRVQHLPRAAHRRAAGPAAG